MVHDDPVAQVDRVSVSEAGGHEFESHRDHHAKVAKLVDALASGASTARREGSSPSFRTILYFYKVTPQNLFPSQKSTTRKWRNW